MAVESLISLLIVEDDPELGETLLELFTFEGFQCEWARSGNLALRMIEKKTYDVVFSDTIMRDGDGVDLLNAIQKSHPNTPVVMAFVESPPDKDVSPTKLRELGAAAVFDKPFDIEVVSKFLRSVVEIGI